MYVNPNMSWIILIDLNDLGGNALLWPVSSCVATS